MWLFLVPVCLAILSSSLSLASEPHFVITVSSQLVQGTEETACVAFLDLKGAVDLKLELKKDNEVHILAEHKIDAKDHDHSECYTFTVPVIKDAVSKRLLHVTVHGEGINWDQSENVVIAKLGMCMIQTDKSIYKPGDVVNFRMISMDSDLHLSHEPKSLVEITDPNKHRIAQWLNVPINHGFADLSFHLSKELSLGEYTINVPPSCVKTFKVEEYVLKRFEVNINTPPTVALIDKTFHLEVCGRYTHGKPVEGSMDVSVCLIDPYNRQYHSADASSEEEEDNCKSVKNQKTDSKGCVSKDIDLGLFNVSKSVRRPYMEIEASLTEDQTEHIEKASGEVIVNIHKKVKFQEHVHTFRKGLPFHVELKVTDEKDQPIPNKSVYLYTGDNIYVPTHESHEAQLTDVNGIAHFTLNASTWTSFRALRATLSPGGDDDDDDESDGLEDSSFAVQFHSVTESHITIKGQSNKPGCDSEEKLTVDYNIQREALNSDTDHLHFFSFLRTLNGNLMFKEHKIDLKDQSNSPNVHGSFPLSFHVDKKLFPFVFVVVYSILPNGETISNLALYEEVPFCVSKKVQLKFSEEQVHPGESVNLEVSASAGSLCSIRSVDKGHLLHTSEKSLLQSDLKKLSEGIKDNTRPFLRIDDDDETRQCPENQTAEIVEGFFPIVDVHMFFTSIGLRIFTNTAVRRPLKCVPITPAARSGVKAKKPGDKDKEISEHFTRKHFPENWLFDLVPVGPEGHTVLNRTTPDSITTWVTDAFCLDKTDFAIASEIELTTFQPYFIDLILPPSVVQGEKFTVQAMVFNYAKKCTLIGVALPDSEEFATVKNREQARCVCEGHSHSFTWEVTAVKPKALKVHVDSGSLEVDGQCTEDPILIKNDQRKDSIEKTIVVKARGYEEEEAQTFLLHLPENKEDLHINLKLPERLVEGSERAHIIVLGDLMANIAANLDDLFHLPDGCGEQNSAKFARYVYTLDYLESIHELKPEKKAEAIEFLVEAYQRQLTFRAEDGAYGFFSGSSNLWITAFVVKAFVSAQHWIYIDDKEIQESVRWLQTQQQPDGCFSSSGHHFNNAVEVDDVSSTAYVIISLLEHPKAYNASVVEDALSCLRKSVDSVKSAYTQALLAYAFSLSEDKELRDQMLKKLEESAVRKEGLKHWETNDQNEIQTESYILLALLSDEATIAKHLEESADIIRWMASQQNPNGGFQSSQDTTVGLQALAKYARATKSKKGDSTVTIKSKSGFEKTVHVHKSNSLLVQMVDLPEIPGEYTVHATGNGFVYLQSHTHYKVLPDKSERGHFSLNVHTEPSACTHASQKKFKIHVDVSYSGKRKNTNMVVILIEPVSGYIPDKTSLKKMKKNLAVKRTEVSAEKISIYLDKLTHDTERLVFSLEQQTIVENLQPATAAVYDYYDPDEHTVVEYNAPCNAESKKTENH
ncbi:alpha-2-macroglobulin-like [Dendropsophus ebraccatus]|uniref:alpha-2-macroglobulin-like n=1 Tax=Dendropsophus ebraccatus TaxID=150705 RepID=UPI0038314387